MKTKFIDGLLFKEPNQNAPEFIKAKGSIKRNDLIGFLQKQSDDWINFDVKVSKNGKWYCSIDDWKPNKTDPTDDIMPEPGKNELDNHMEGTQDDLPF